MTAQYWEGVASGVVAAWLVLGAVLVRAVRKVRRRLNQRV